MVMICPSTIPTVCVNESERSHATQLVMEPLSRRDSRLSPMWYIVSAVSYNPILSRYDHTADMSMPEIMIQFMSWALSSDRILPR